jgi:hypothetical protein
VADPEAARQAADPDRAHHRVKGGRSLGVIARSAATKQSRTALRFLNCFASLTMTVPSRALAAKN